MIEGSFSLRYKQMVLGALSVFSVLSCRPPQSNSSYSMGEMFTSGRMQASTQIESPKPGVISEALAARDIAEFFPELAARPLISSFNFTARFGEARVYNVDNRVLVDPVKFAAKLRFFEDFANERGTFGYRLEDKDTNTTYIIPVKYEAEKPATRIFFIVPQNQPFTSDHLARSPFLHETDAYTFSPDNQETKVSYIRVLSKEAFRRKSPTEAPWLDANTEISIEDCQQATLLRVDIPKGAPNPERIQDNIQEMLCNGAVGRTEDLKNKGQTFAQITNILSGKGTNLTDEQGNRLDDYRLTFFNEKEFNTIPSTGLPISFK
jgi:hypothetical protein